jgi:hypothetical protein
MANRLQRLEIERDDRVEKGMRRPALRDEGLDDFERREVDGDTCAEGVRPSTRHSVRRARAYGLKKRLDRPVRA